MRSSWKTRRPRYKQRKHPTVCRTWIIKTAVAATGRYSIPSVASVPGLAAFAAVRLGSVVHGKLCRGRDAYAGRDAIVIIVIDASASTADIINTGYTWAVPFFQ
ncbi:hypothetical protein LY78DRAFT_679955 [Colletotrichum sublineola]|nr:hypothetical protein LY78DRAFT_679955 [Colletotrichum sublineola]